MALTRKPSGPVTVKRAAPTLATLMVGVALNGCIETTIGEPPITETVGLIALPVDMGPVDMGPVNLGEPALSGVESNVGLIAEPRDMEPIEVGLLPEFEDMEPEFVDQFVLDVDMSEEMSGDMEPIVVGLPPLPEDMGVPEGGDEG